MNLIKSVRAETDAVQALLENVSHVPNKKGLFESADKMIGAAIAALKVGKNPFETMPGSQEVIAGLMLLANDENRSALNLNPKKFDIVSQKLSDSKAAQKYVAQIAQDSGPSLVKNLGVYVQDEGKREVLTKKLVQLQNVYNKVKHKANTGDEISKVA